MTDDSDQTRDGLDDNWIDKAVAVTKGATGLIPMIGGPLAEIVGVIVPGQRADRIASYLRQLGQRVDQMNSDVRAALAESAEKIGLIEDGGYQAARATTAERIKRIVEAVERGLDADETEVVRRKRLLTLLGDIDDDELNLLNAYGRTYGGRDRNAFEQVNRPDPMHMQSSREDIERTHLYDAGKEHLLRLGLLKRNFGTVKKGQLPEFDTRSGQFKHNVEVSSLGRMLLKEIGLGIPLDED